MTAWRAGATASISAPVSAPARRSAQDQVAVVTSRTFGMPGEYENNSQPLVKNSYVTAAPSPSDHVPNWYRRMNGFCDVAIIGAGPYGLSLAAHSLKAGLNVRVFGKPLSTWRSHMPSGMLLK